MGTLLWLTAGLALLIGGGTLVVQGASAIAARFGVSPLIVGLTIVAFGTSAPELVVNVAGALRNQTHLAFGNVVGSNIANLGLVLGVAAFFRGIEIHGTIVRREVPLLLLATVAIVIMASDGILRSQPQRVDISEGLILFLLFALFMYVTAQDVLNKRESDTLLAEIESTSLINPMPAKSYDWVLLLAGFVALVWGGQLTITNGVALAGLLGVSSTIIGLFVVALGTSLPELVTSIIAAVRGESDLAVGNVVGSNLFNALMVLPVSTLVRPIGIPAGGMIDLVASLIFAAALIPLFWMGRARMGRRMGLFFCAMYVVYATARVSFSA